MDKILNSWWVWAIRGVFAIIFGLVAIFNPGEALEALIYVFGIYALIDGGVTIYQAVANRANNWVWHLVEGIVSVLAGLAAFFLTALTFLTLLVLIAIWAIFTGIMQIMAAWRLREEIDNEIWLGLAGLVSVIFGVFIFFDPFSGAVATAWVIGTYSIAFGIFMLMLAFRLANFAKNNKSTVAA